MSAASNTSVRVKNNRYGLGVCSRTRVSMWMAESLDTGSEGMVLARGGGADVGLSPLSLESCREKGQGKLEGGRGKPHSSRG